MATSKFDIYEHINNVVLEGLKTDGLSWFKSWTDNDGPMNRATKTFYKGMNIFWLNFICRSREYSSNQWLTYKQATELGGSVMKGQKSTMVFFYHISYYHKPTDKWYNDTQLKKAKIARSECSKTSFQLRYYNVFNVDQIEGVEPLEIDNASELTESAAAEYMIGGYVEASGLTYKHGTGGAYYHPKKDLVNMPEPTTFVDTDSYYKTAFHELAHSTGHEDRLKRQGITDVKVWGDNTYAKEELVAEIAAMYLTGECGLNPKDDHINSQAYLNGWVKKLEDSKHEIVNAMQQASKAVEYIKNLKITK